MVNRFTKQIGCALIILVLSSCSSLQPGDETASERRIDYKKAAAVAPLEVPPELTEPEAEHQLVIPEEPTTFSDYDAQTTQHRSERIPSDLQVLPLTEHIQLKRAGGIRWLVLPGEPETFWPQIRNFWQAQGFTLALEHPQIGIMETQWAENRADMPQDSLQRLLGRLGNVLYATPTRDKFRVRLEPGRSAGTTELYLTHRGAQEVTQGDFVTWKPRPSEAELEAEMLNRLLVYLGTKEEQAQTIAQHYEQAPTKTTDKATLIQNADTLALTLQADFPQAWHLIGITLDRAGFTVEDRNREQGLYFIRYVDPEHNQKAGFFDKLFGRQPPADQHDYQLHLSEQGPMTRIVVQDAHGALATGSTAEKILKVLQEHVQ